MAELQQELRALGAEVADPQTPDLASEVRRRVEAHPAGRFTWPSRRLVVVALSVLAIVAGVMAVPQARSAILRLFGIGGVTVVQVDELPRVDAPPIYLGQRVSRAEAQRRADFDVLEPDLDAADAVYALDGPTGVQVGLLWGSERRPRLLFTQFRGRVGTEFARKIVGEGTRIEHVRVNGVPALWLSGRPHFFYYVDAASNPHEQELALARNTLLWTKGALTFRLEGELSKAEALEIAESVD
jgi:hypothetical protein